VGWDCKKDVYLVAVRFEQDNQPHLLTTVPDLLKQLFTLIIPGRVNLQAQRKQFPVNIAAKHHVTVHAPRLEHLDGLGKALDHRFSQVLSVERGFRCQQGERAEDEVFGGFGKSGGGPVVDVRGEFDFLGAPELGLGVLVRLPELVTRMS
jgi:hypothetical protein